MNFFKQIYKWEKKIEKEPKEKLIKMLSILFVSTVVFGFMLQTRFNNMQNEVINETVQNLKEMERQRMEARIQELQTFRYARR